MIEIINFILGIVVVVGMGFFAYMSSVLVSEKKQRERNDWSISLVIIYICKYVDSCSYVVRNENKIMFEKIVTYTVFSVLFMILFVTIYLMLNPDKYQYAEDRGTHSSTRELEVSRMQPSYRKVV